MASDRALTLLAACPDDVAPQLVDDVTAALLARHGRALRAEETIRIEAKVGARAAFVNARIGPPLRPFEIELFVDDVAGALLDGALGVLVDYLDGVLTEYFAEDRAALLPLEFQRRAYDDHTVLVRSEVRDLALEQAADMLLGDDT